MTATSDCQIYRLYGKGQSSCLQRRDSRPLRQLGGLGLGQLEEPSNKTVGRNAIDASWNLFADGLFTGNDSHDFKFGLSTKP